MTSRQTYDRLKQKFGDAVGEAVEFRGEISAVIAADKILPVCEFLKSDSETAYDMLLDLSGVDNYGEDPRFEAAYLLYSLKNRCWLRLKAKVSEDTCTIDSVTSVWQGANWHEREAFDMFGIKFRGHPELRRILMWDGYPHFPLRKDFPLAGIPADMPAKEIFPDDYKQIEVSPMLGGPFVPGTGTNLSKRREPRQKDVVIEKPLTQEKGSLPGGED